MYLDAGKLDEYAEIKNWFLKLTPKREQDEDRLIREIVEAGSRILGVTGVQVNSALIGKKSSGKISICPACGEAYPARDGASCLACQGTALYGSAYM